MTTTQIRDPNSQTGGHSAALSTGEEMASVCAGAWMVVGLFLDGLAHVELEPESFFTLSHLILYSGFAIATVAGIIPVIRRHRPGAAWTTAIPIGHGLTLGGVAMFGVGALLDLIWHETVGIEVSNEALLSPTHLLLLTGGLLALSGPLRNGMRTLGWHSPRRAWWPTTGSLALVASVATFFTSYLSPFGREAAASFPTTRTHTHELEVATAAAFGQLREVWGIAGILAATTIFTIALLALLRPAVPPPGVISALFLSFAIASPAIGEFRQWFAAVALLAGGVATDALARRRVNRSLLCATAIATTWSIYFAALATREQLEWSPSLWVGSIFLAVLVATTLGWLATTPSDAPHGPRAPEWTNSGPEQPTGAPQPPGQR